MTVVRLSAHHPVMVVIGEVDRTDNHLSFICSAGSILLCRIGVADAMTVVCTHADAQARDAIVVYAERTAVFISHIKLQRRFRTFVYPPCICEMVGIESCQELRLITPVAITSPERESRLMPSGRQNDVFAFWTINGEEVKWLMVGIVESYRHYDMSHPEVSPGSE